MFRNTAAYLLFAVLAIAAAGETPADAIRDARNAIAAGAHARAIALLRAALPGAANNPDALAAIHFYSALAYWTSGDASAARSELSAFGAIRTGTNKLDTAKYPSGFIAVFNEVAGHDAASPTSFSSHYPGFDGTYVAAATAVPIVLWGTSAAMQLLASDAEKQEWEQLREDTARGEFVAKFWAGRDPESTTAANEWRVEFERRASFADRAFETGNAALRGSLTDRGRVFVLLGPPARIYATSIARRQGGFTNFNGIDERWVYFRPQLPPSVRQPVLEFRFIDQPAYGDYVLERDPLPLFALAEAKKSFCGAR